jgi:hypothetical protein
MTIYSWEEATICDFEPLKDTAGWLQCPQCKEHPRTWVFDNGNYARCRCNYKYEKGGAEALSINVAMRDRNLSYDEYRLLLRDAWNYHISALSTLSVPAEEVLP